MSEPEKPNKSPHPNAGHRERMRARFLENGLDSLQPHEVLELLLFYALPRVNTNPIAHALIREFHSLSGVLDADPADLKRVKGVGDNAAAFLHMLPQLCRLYQLDRLKDCDVMDSAEKLSDYVKAQLTGQVQERLLLICLDESLRLICCEVISEGTTQETRLDVHRIVECAIRRRSSKVVLAHNHPNAGAALSDADLFSTGQLKKILESMHVKLLDHIVVGRKGDTVSMRQYMGWTE